MKNVARVKIIFKQVSNCFLICLSLVRRTSFYTCRLVALECGLLSKMHFLHAFPSFIVCFKQEMLNTHLFFGKCHWWEEGSTKFCKRNMRSNAIYNNKCQEKFVHCLEVVYVWIHVEHIKKYKKSKAEAVVNYTLK